MGRKLIAGVILTASLGLASAAVFAAPLFSKHREEKLDGGEIKWQHDIFAAHRVATAENKPILMVFGAEWCGFCKKLEKQTLTDAELAQYINQTFVPVHLDLDKEERVGKILEIQSLPCTVVLTADAELLGRIEGYLAPTPYMQKLVEAQLNFQQVQAAFGNRDRDSLGLTMAGL